MGEIWVLRHCETEWSAEGRHTSGTDVPLTPKGEEHARRLAPRLARQWDLVLCSPLQRARRTAELAGLDPTFDEDLREWEYGPAEGKTTQQVSEELGHSWSVWDEPLGETLEELAARSHRVLSRLPGGDVLLVGHGHSLRVLSAVYLELRPIAAKHLSLGPGATGVLASEHSWPALTKWDV